MICWQFLAACFRLVTICHATCMRHKNYFVHLRCLTSRYMLVRMDASCLGKTMQMQSTALNVNHLDIWRSTQVMVRRGNSRSPWKSYGTFHSYRGSNGFTWPRNPLNRWHGTKKANDTVLRTWYIQPMLKHGSILIDVIVRKLGSLVMYVLHWQQMGLIPIEWRLPHTLVGPCSLSPSIYPLESCFNDITYSCRW